MNTLKRIGLSGLLAGLPFIAAAQTTQGFVQSETIKIAGITTDSQIYPLSATDKTTVRSYYDGLGRPIQTVAVKASPGQKDLVQPMAYNTLGQQTKAYLPYVGTDGNGELHTSALTEQAAFYSNGVSDKVADDSQPWSQNLPETSPLQRILKAGTVGDGYQTNQHYKTVDRRTNVSGDYVVEWLPDGSNNGYYPAGTLDVADAIDEQGGEMKTFTNTAGQVVLKRQLAPGATWLNTYFIYNDAGQTVYVVPPKAEAVMASGGYSVTTTGVDKLLFKMAYDDRGRMVEKTVPGGGVSYIIYDLLNRPVLVQDAKLRAANQWIYVKYDVQGRTISQGTYTDNTYLTRVNMQAYADGLTTLYSTTWYETRDSGASSTGYYTNNTFPSSGITQLAYSYYDDYDINADGTADIAYQTQSLTGEAGATTITNGMPTATSKRTISPSGSPVWLTSYMFYDKYGHSIQVRSNNHVYGTVADVATSVPDRTGKPTITRVVKYISSGSSTTVQTNYSYDHMDRVTAIDQQYNGGSTVHVATYAYNELGQLVDKKLGVNGSSFLQSLDYRYNIRGQLTSINNSTLSDDHTTTNTNDDSNDLFGMELVYDQSYSGLSNTPYYNGQLSAALWMSRDASGVPVNQRAFTYSYNEQNFLTAGNYLEKVSGSWSANNAYTESGISYDQNGNITALQRKVLSGGSVITADDLTYTYDSSNPNRLYTVSDASGNNSFGFKNLTGVSGTAHYDYDDSGNLTADPYKGLTIDYNALNKTEKITVTTATGRYINYTYDASGTLLRKDQYDGGTLQHTTDYIDGFVYQDGTLDYFAAPEGRVRNTGSALKNEYIITDQQGNARISFEDNGSGTAVVRQENSYYAFGLPIPSQSVATPTQPNKFLYNGGSEWQNDYGDLPDLMQTFYRNYDAALGRFIAVDPMAEATANLTVYEYAGNNPVMMNDPGGDKFDMNSDYMYQPGYHDNIAMESANRNYQAMQAMVLELNGWSGDMDQGLVAGGNGGGGKFKTWDDVNSALGQLTGEDSNYFGGIAYGADDIDYYYDAQSALAAGAAVMAGNNAYGAHAGWATSYANAVSNYNEANGTSYGIPLGNYASVTTWNQRDAQGNSAVINGTSASTVMMKVTPGGMVVADRDRESTWSEVWNSEVMRNIVPDVVGLHLGAVLVPTIGAGYSFNFDLLTRGKDAGFHMSQSFSGRIGEEGGIGFSLVSGRFQGRGQDATYSSLTGWGADLNGAAGPLNIGVWGSIDTNAKRASWLGASVGTGWGIGGSGGISYTWPIK